MEPKGNDMAELQARYDAQVDYGIDLQRIIEALCKGREIPEPKTTARHHFDMAVRARLSRSTSTDAVARRAERWPEPGDRMRFLGENGYPLELEAALKVMQPGDTFTVKSGWVGSYSNSIRFEEIDGSWNGVMFAFEDACPSPQGAVPFEYFDAWRKRAIDAEGQLGHVYDPTMQPYDEPFRHPSLQGGAEPDGIYIEAFCKPWEFGAGDPPDYESPLTGVYTAGISYAFDHLAGLLNVHDYTGSDGAGTLEGDVCGTLQNILVAAGFVDKNGDITHSLGETGGPADAVSEAEITDAMINAALNEYLPACYPTCQDAMRAALEAAQRARK